MRILGEMIERREEVSMADDQIKLTSMTAASG